MAWNFPRCRSANGELVARVAPIAAEACSLSRRPSRSASSSAHHRGAGRRATVGADGRGAAIPRLHVKSGAISAGKVTICPFRHFPNAFSGIHGTCPVSLTGHHGCQPHWQRGRQGGAPPQRPAFSFAIGR
jgi:hypothetical protein